MSLPVCWDTLRAGTNEGYFEFNQTTFLAHVAISYRIVLIMCVSFL
jgi:hypothetical protein